MLTDISHKAEGNDAVIQLFESWLERARLGQLESACVVATDSPTSYSLGQAGIIGFEFALIEALNDMQGKLRDHIKNRTPPPPDANATADRVLYNLARMSSSFDFLAWIVNAEMTRVRAGAPAPLKIGFFHGYTTTLEEALAGGARAHNFEHIVRPIVSMLGAVEDPGAVRGTRLETLSLVPVVDAYRAGEPLPVLKLSDESSAEVSKALMEACGGKLPVTITLREADHFPNRNSNLTEWLKFAEWLEERGEKVLFIRDTSKAEEPITGYPTCPPASLDLSFRMAVYQTAKTNLFVSNGPAMLAVLFSEKPWLFVNELNVGDKFIPNTPDGWRHFVGIHAGEQVPWAKPNQRFIYKPDTFENIRDAWLEHIEPQMKAAA